MRQEVYLVINWKTTSYPVNMSNKISAPRKTMFFYLLVNLVAYDEATLNR